MQRLIAYAISRFNKYIYKQLLYLGLGEHGGGGDRKPENQEACYEIMSPRSDRKATPMIPQQYGCLRKTSAMTKLLDTLT